MSLHLSHVTFCSSVTCHILKHFAWQVVLNFSHTALFLKFDILSLQTLEMAHFNPQYQTVKWDLKKGMLKKKNCRHIILNLNNENLCQSNLLKFVHSLWFSYFLEDFPLVLAEVSYMPWKLQQWGFIYHLPQDSRMYQ